MFNLNLLEMIFLIASITSAISLSIVQKTKCFFKTSKFIPLYSIFINTTVSILFSITFTNIHFPIYLWIGLLSFIGTDTIYKTFEGKLERHSDKRGKYNKTSQK